MLFSFPLGRSKIKRLAGVSSVHRGSCACSPRFFTMGSQRHQGGQVGHFDLRLDKRQNVERPTMPSLRQRERICSHIDYKGREGLPPRVALIAGTRQLRHVGKGYRIRLFRRHIMGISIRRIWWPSQKRSRERGARKLSSSDYSKLVLNEENSTTIKSVSMASHPAVASLFMPHKFTMRMQKIYTWRLCISKGLLED